MRRILALGTLLFAAMPAHAVITSVIGLGGGKPGGSNTQVQYNDHGSFQGNPNFTFDAVTGSVTVSGGMISVSSASSTGILSTIRVLETTKGTYFGTPIPYHAIYNTVSGFSPGNNFAIITTTVPYENLPAGAFFPTGQYTSIQMDAGYPQNGNSGDMFITVSGSLVWDFFNNQMDFYVTPLFQAGLITSTFTTTGVSNFGAYAQFASSISITGLTAGTTFFYSSGSVTGASLNINKLAYAWPSSQATNRLLKNTGPGTLSWSQADLTTDVTNTLGVGNGGTGVNTLALNGVLYGNAASPVLVTAAGAANTVLASVTGAAPTFTGSPIVSTLTAITMMVLPNSSTHTVTSIGQVVIDTDAISSSMGTMLIHDGTQKLFVVTSTNTPSNGQVPKYNSATGKVIWDTDATGGAGGGGGYAVEPATVTFQLNKGVTASTGVFTSSVTAPYVAVSTLVVTSSGTFGISTFISSVTLTNGNLILPATTQDGTPLSISWNVGSLPGFWVKSTDNNSLNYTTGSGLTNRAFRFDGLNSTIYGALMLQNAGGSNVAALRVVGSYGANPLSSATLVGITHSAGSGAAVYMGLTDPGVAYSTTTGQYFVIGSSYPSTGGVNSDVIGLNFLTIDVSTQSTRGNVLVATGTFTVVSGSTQPSTLNNGLVVTGHISVSSATPSVTSCGTSPSIVGNDQFGKITVGSGVIGTCTMTFSVPWPNAPTCQILSGTVIASPTGTTTTTAFTFTGTSLTSDVVMYMCGGWQ